MGTTAVDGASPDAESRPLEAQSRARGLAQEIVNTAVVKAIATVVSQAAVELAVQQKTVELMGPTMYETAESALIDSTSPLPSNVDAATASSVNDGTSLLTQSPGGGTRRMVATANQEALLRIRFTQEIEQIMSKRVPPPRRRRWYERWGKRVRRLFGGKARASHDVGGQQWSPAGQATRKANANPEALHRANRALSNLALSV